MLQKTVFAALAATFLAGPVQGGEPAPPVLRGAIATAPAAPHVFHGDLRQLPPPSEWRPGDGVRQLGRRTRTPPAPPSAAPFGPPAEDFADPLVALQTTHGNQLTDPDFGVPLLNFTAQAYSGFSPPSPSGDVGGSHFIQSINGATGGARIVIYDKTTGAIVAGPFALETLGAGDCASGFGRGIVLYDRMAGRWLLSELASSGGGLCVYVSQTGDPVAGGWYAYFFATPTFPDYPKYGVWRDAYYVGANESSPSLIALDRTRMLAGLPATSQRFIAPELSAFGFQMLAPVDHDGPSPPPDGEPGLFLRHLDDEAHSQPDVAGADALELFEFRVDWTTPANSTLTGPIAVPIAEISSNFCGFTSFSCIPQPGVVQLDPLREVVMNKPTYRHRRGTQLVVGSLATNVAANPAANTNAGVRWFELRKSTGTAAYALRQQGTLAGAPCSGICDFPQRWMSSVAIDGAGGMAAVYNYASDTSNFPGLRYSGRLASDPLGTLPQGENLLVAGAAASNTNLYGDYAQLTLDDGDGCTFFYTGEFSPAANWATRIASFRFRTCATGNPVFANGFESGNTAAWSITLP